MRVLLSVLGFLLTLTLASGAPCSFQYEKNQDLLEVDWLGCNKNLETFLAQWTNVTRLRISSSGLTSVPRSISLMKSLTHLDLKNNYLTDYKFHDVMESLEVLILSGNNIEKTTDNFTEAPNLQVLSLANNNISTLEPSFFLDETMDKLFWLDMRGNHLQELDLAFLHFLQKHCHTREPRLILRENKIKKFTNHNGLTIDSIGSECNGSIDLRGNEFYSANDIDLLKLLSASISQLDKLSTLTVDFGNAKWSCDCEMYDLLKRLRAGPSEKQVHLFYDNIKCASPLSAFGKTLKDVPLDDLFCEIPCTDGCSCYHLPATDTSRMFCKNMHLTELPYELPEATHLSLHLPGNLISVLEPRNYFDKLVVLDLQDNRLESLEADVMSLLSRNMEVLLLGSNDIQRIDSAVWKDISWPSLSSIRVSLNPFVCDCDYEEFHKWIRQVNDHPEEIHCISDKGENVPWEEYCTPVPLAKDQSLLLTICISLGVILCVMVVTTVLALWRIKKNKSKCKTPLKEETEEEKKSLQDNHVI